MWVNNSRIIYTKYNMLIENLTKIKKTSIDETSLEPFIPNKWQNVIVVTSLFRISTLEYDQIRITLIRMRRKHKIYYTPKLIPRQQLADVIHTRPSPPTSYYYTTNYRCGYTGNFYLGKWPFYRGKLAWCVWPDFPEINLPREISVVTSKKKKKTETAHDIKHGKSLGFFDTPGKRANQVSLFDTNLKPQKKLLFSTFFSRAI